MSSMKQKDLKQRPFYVHYPATQIEWVLISLGFPPHICSHARQRDYSFRFLSFPSEHEILKSSRIESIVHTYIDRYDHLPAMLLGFVM